MRVKIIAVFFGLSIMCFPASTCYSSACNWSVPWLSLVRHRLKDLQVADVIPKTNPYSSNTIRILRCPNKHQLHVSDLPGWSKRSRQSPDLGRHPSSANRNPFVRGRGGTRRELRTKGGTKKANLSWHRPPACGSTDARRRSEERHHQSIATGLFLFVLEMSSGRGALPLGHFDHGLP
jgi:hypothetical protein